MTLQPSDVHVCPICSMALLARPGWSLDATFVRHVLSFHVEDVLGELEAHRAEDEAQS